MIFSSQFLIVQIMLFQSNTEKTIVLCSNIKQGQYDQALRYIVVVFILDIDDTD